MSVTALKPAFDPALLAASMAALGGANSTTAAPAKEKATLYLAIGTVRDGVDDTTGFDPKTDLINLPQLIGLDNMRPDDRRAGTQEFADEQAEKNEFLADLVEQALATMEPGEIRTMPFVVTIYRKKDEVVAAPKPQREKRKYL